MHELVAQRFKEITPSVDFCSLRLVEERTERIHVRQNVLEPLVDQSDVGAMITVVHRGGLGYAATTDLSASGLKAAASRACTWAEMSREHTVTNFSEIDMGQPIASYTTPVQEHWEATSLSAKIELLQDINTKLRIHDRIVDWEAWLANIDTKSLYLTADGGRVDQHLRHLFPSIVVVANAGTLTQRRSFQEHCRQGGLEILDALEFEKRSQTLPQEALALLDAPNCPSDRMDLVLAPDQMMLQIHESIGHPIELDRILGDERNYAGTSFVTPDMFGQYQYGSDLLNVSFDPQRAHEFACYQHDDDGAHADKVMIIERGILKRGLGGTVSQARSGLAGASSTRASSWNRPPIDRMANLNLEAGDTSFESMINQVERGVLMKTNTSWSIDDSRNKFQFGCELGQLIEDGTLKGLVRNPSYRGISATFWRNLKAVGTPDTGDICGTPYCGKGEPNQVIRVGHASPTCLFSAVDVFGGES